MNDQPDAPAAPQLYLITPVGAEPSVVSPMLAEIIERFEVACIRIPGGGDAAQLGRMADTVRELAHANDIAVVIEDHIKLAQQHGLDGVHLLKPSGKNIRLARQELGPDAIVGAYCGASRHEGISAAEAGADYVSFGPMGETALGHGERAALDLFEWWSEVIEVPIIAEGALTAELVAKFGPVTDFFAVGEEIWAADDPLAALKALLAPLG